MRTRAAAVPRGFTSDAAAIKARCLAAGTRDEACSASRHDTYMPPMTAMFLFERCLPRRDMRIAERVAPYLMPIHLSSDFMLPIPARYVLRLICRYPYDMLQESCHAAMMLCCHEEAAEEVCRVICHQRLTPTFLAHLLLMFESMLYACYLCAYRRYVASVPTSIPVIRLPASITIRHACYAQ